MKKIVLTILAIILVAHCACNAKIKNKVEYPNDILIGVCDKKHRCGYVNLKNEVVVPFKYRFVNHKINEQGYSIVSRLDDGLYGVIDKKGNIIATGNNQVLKNNDPTAHAEVMAIRNACAKLNTYDLSEYILYTSCEPCPMCLSAIIWSNIKEIYYACTREDAAKIGFRDDLIYEYLKGNNQDIIELHQIDRDACIETFEKYEQENKTIY